MTAKDLARRLTPPALWDAARALRRRLGPSEWEVVTEGWSRPVRGWDVDEVARAQRDAWPQFAAAIAGASPLAVSHEALRLGVTDPSAHHTLMCWGYVLARAAARRERLALLDWGGGIGHYYALSRALVPEIVIDYHCRDLPAACREGRALFPGAHFHDDDDSTFGRRYDLVLVSSTLQYHEDWRGVVDRLAAVTDGFLYVTRLPVIERAASFVVLQRAERYGYGTEYLGWFLHRGTFVDHVEGRGMRLEREFLLDERPEVPGAPEACTYRGFLFRPAGVRA